MVLLTHFDPLNTNIPVKNTLKIFLKLCRLIKKVGIYSLRLDISIDIKKSIVNELNDEKNEFENEYKTREAYERGFSSEHIFFYCLVIKICNVMKN